MQPEIPVTPANAPCTPAYKRSDAEQSTLNLQRRKNEHLDKKTSANHASISTSNREVNRRAHSSTNHKQRQIQRWSNTIHVKKGRWKYKDDPTKQTKHRQRQRQSWSHHKSQAKAIAKKKHDLTTNHRQRLPGWRLFRLGIGTTLDRVQSLYPERNYFVWFLGIASQPSADWEVTELYNGHIEKKYDKADLETNMISLAPLVWIGIVTSSNPVRARKVSLLHNKHIRLKV